MSDAIELTTEVRAEAFQIIRTLADDADVIAMAKPSRFPSSKHDYVGYMVKLSELRQLGVPFNAGATVLILAGGDRRGVEAAYRAVTGVMLEEAFA